MSSSRLAVRNISKLISEDAQGVIVREQKTALDLRDRLNPTAFMDLLRSLSDLFTTQEMFYTHIDYTIKALNASQQNLHYGLKLFKSDVLDYDLGMNFSYPIKNLSPILQANKLHIQPFTTYLYTALEQIQGQLLLLEVQLGDLGPEEEP